MKLFWEYNWISVEDIVSLGKFASRGFPTTGTNNNIFLQNGKVVDLEYLVGC